MFSDSFGPPPPQMAGVFTSGNSSRPTCRNPLSVGRPRFMDQDLASMCQEQGALKAWTTAFERFGIDAPSRVEGEFSVAVPDSKGRLLMAVDRFATHSLCYRLSGEHLYFSTRADDVAPPQCSLDPQAIFEYLYFHVIPTPRTVFKHVSRLPPGHVALLHRGQLTVARYFVPTFEYDSKASIADLKSEFLTTLRRSVQFHADNPNVGCFLSGGTDSSTIAGLLGEIHGTPPRTFSIGFSAEGYDEMAYARIAARHFGTQHHEYYVTADDIVRAVPSIAKYTDQPFGNSSIVPAYFCAKMARDRGIQHLLAGDGGDELFGGNSRYVKLRLLALYGGLPVLLRQRIIEPVLHGNCALSTIYGFRKLVSYVEQARVQMPERMYIHNLLTSIGFKEVLTSDFLNSVDHSMVTSQMRAVYAACQSRSLTNQMLAFDWRYTLADSDLPKVQYASQLAGADVSFPLLENQLVDFSLRLPPEYKVKGRRLRWFFKDALRDFLPHAIITKKKHGFGLPFGVWLMCQGKLRDLALSSLDSLREGGIIRPQFIDGLATNYLPRSSSYYGEMVWILMMLAQWNSQRLNAPQPTMAPHYVPRSPGASAT